MKISNLHWSWLLIIYFFWGITLPNDAIETIIERAETELKAANFQTTLDLLSGIETEISKAGKKERIRYERKSLLLKGSAQYGLARYDTAISLLERALTLPQPKTKEEKIVLHALYHYLYKAYDDKGDNKLGKAKLDKLKLENKADPVSWPLAYLYEDIGRYYYPEGKIQESEKWFQKARETRAQIKPENQLEFLRNFNLLADIAIHQGDSKTALQQLQKALQVARDNKANPITLANIYARRSRAYFLERDLVSAEENILQSIELASEKLPIDHPLIAGFRDELAKIYREKGEADELEKAFSLYRELIDTGEKKYPDLLLHRAIFNHNLHLVYLSKGDLESALEKLQLAIGILVAYEDRHSEVRQLLYGAYNSQANLFYYLGQYEKAVEVYNGQIELGERWFGPKHINLVQVLSNKGVTQQVMKDYAGAEQTYASIYPILGIEPESDAPFENVRYIDGAIKVIWNHAETIKMRISASLNYDLLPEALEKFDFYLEFIDYIRTSYHEEGSKDRLAKENKIAYETSLLLHWIYCDYTGNQSDAERAFAVNERSRSLSLFDAVRLKSVGRFADVPAEVLQKEAALQQQLQNLNKRLFQQAYSIENEGQNQISDSLLLVKQNYDHFLEELKEKYPSYFQEKYATPSLDLPAIKKKLREERSTLVSYFVGDKYHFAFIVTPDSVHFQQFQLSYKVDDAVEKLAKGITGYWGDPRKSPARYRESKQLFDSTAYQLYLDWIEPLEKYIDQKIVIVPDGELGLIPFGALLKEAPAASGNFSDYNYLQKYFSISYVHSASLWLKADGGRLKTDGEGCLGFAPNYLGKPLQNINLPGLGALQQEPLKYNISEVQMVQSLMGGRAITKQAATKAAFLESLNNLEILHLAVHGNADYADGRLSHLVFYDDSGDGLKTLLFAQEIYAYTIPAKMVVLSACETGVGKVQKGEGIVSLSRAFAYAGAQSLVHSLWKVDDEATSELMRQFYIQLKSKKCKDEALGLAKQSLIEQSKNSDWAHPYFWASFVHYGDASALE